MVMRGIDKCKIWREGGTAAAAFAAILTTSLEFEMHGVALAAPAEAEERCQLHRKR